MSTPDDSARPDARKSLDRDIERHGRREDQNESFWRSLSLLGTVGWPIALLATAGAWLGHQLDVHFATGVRFTLVLLTAGVALGSVVAWRALREHRE